jgi:hypothetical protein
MLREDKLKTMQPFKLKDITKVLFSLFCLVIFSQAWADTPEKCSDQAVQISIRGDCHMKFEGSYSLKLCENGRGFLSNRMGFQRQFFVIGSTLVARRDLLDYNDNTRTTEILQIDKTLTEFRVSITKTDQQGIVLHQDNCLGSIIK